MASEARKPLQKYIDHDLHHDDGVEEHINLFEGWLSVTGNIRKSYGGSNCWWVMVVGNWNGDVLAKNQIIIYPDDKCIQPEKIIVLDNNVQIVRDQSSSVLVHGFTPSGLKVRYCFSDLPIEEDEERLLPHFYEACISVEYCNVDDIGLRALARDGAGLKLKWIAETPLHHAAKRGLEPTVKQYLANGANPFVMNDDCQTPLDVARAEGFSRVVRAIESHICLFSGSICEMLGPLWLSRKIWAVVLPCDTFAYKGLVKLELAMYPSSEIAYKLLIRDVFDEGQDAQPREVIKLWAAQIEEPTFHQPDPVMIIIDNIRKRRYRFASANEGDMEQLQSFYDACTGVPQVMHHPRPSTHSAPVIPVIPSAPPMPEDAYNSPIHYPPIDISSINISSITIDEKPPSGARKEDKVSLCVICSDAPIEGALVPCGHMVGCMSCLEAIEDEKSGCPVCRTEVYQVLRLYAAM